MLTVIYVILEVFCGVLPTVKHARYNLEECGRGQVPLGFKCQLSCEEGFHNNGPSKYTCEYEGRPVWNPKALPICQGKGIFGIFSIDFIVCWINIMISFLVFFKSDCVVGNAWWRVDEIARRRVTVPVL